MREPLPSRCDTISKLVEETFRELEYILGPPATRSNRLKELVVNPWLVEQFIHSFKRTPRWLILDFDATDDAVHGEQVDRFFHDYYDRYCYLPLYVFLGR